MAREDGYFKPGNEGRPKGSRNRRTKVAEEFAQSFLKEAGFQEALETVLHDPTHEHWRWATELMYHYAYGKPVERSISFNKEDVHTHGDTLETALNHAQRLRETNGHSVVSAN